MKEASYYAAEEKSRPQEIREIQRGRGDVLDVPVKIRRYIAVLSMLQDAIWKRYKKIVNEEVKALAKGAK